MPTSLTTSEAPFLLRFSFPGLPQVQCAFGCALGGQSQENFAAGNISLEVSDNAKTVLQNRKACQKALGFSVWQELQQVHGQEMHADLEKDFLQGPELPGDGLCTTQKNTALVIKTADCQPLLLAHTSGQYIAALHCGWKGNAGNFPGQGVGIFCARYGLQPVDVLVVRGPSLGPGKSEFRHFHTEWGKQFDHYYKPQSQTVNLWKLTQDQLLAAGIHADHIFSLDICTFSSRQFFSYRRHKVTGRQGSFIWMTP